MSDIGTHALYNKALEMANISRLLDETPSFLTKSPETDPRADPATPSFGPVECGGICRRGKRRAVKLTPLCVSQIGRTGTCLRFSESGAPSRRGLGRLYQSTDIAEPGRVCGTGPNPLGGPAPASVSF